MAAALLRHALAAEEEPLKSLTVESAGLATGAGRPASDHAVRALKNVNIDLSGHQSQPVTEELIVRSLAIFGMTESHRLILEQEFDLQGTPVFLFREFMAEGEETQVPDPFGASLPAYEATRDALVEAVPSLLQYLRETVKAAY